jgi:hypothetical protein
MPKIVQYNLPPGGTVVQIPSGTSNALAIQDPAGEDYLTIDTTAGAEIVEIGVGPGDGGDIKEAGIQIMEINSQAELRICDEMGFINDPDTQIRLKTANTMAFKTGGGEVMTLGASGAVTLIGLPTSDPGVVNRLWNSSGTLKISAG